MKSKVIFAETLLDIPLYGDKPCNEKRQRVIVDAKKYAPCMDFPEGDAFVSISSHGLNVAIDERHLDLVIEALIKARELYKK